MDFISLSRSFKKFSVKQTSFDRCCLRLKTSITLNTIKNSKWLMYQAEIANINIENLKFKELTKKNGKVSSAMLYDNEKYIVLMMGSNNLPSIY